MSMSVKKMIESLLIDKDPRMWSQDFKLDPISDPFPNDVAAQVLQIDECELIYLKNLNYISAACSLNQFDSLSPRFLCYWDILEATLFMSLVSIRCPITCAAECAPLICDLLAHHQECAPIEYELDVFGVAEIIQSQIMSGDLSQCMAEIGIYTSILSLKLAIDLMNVHSRCLSYVACSDRHVQVELMQNSDARHGSDDVTAPRRHQCAKVGLRGSTKESGHVGDYHGRTRSGEECVSGPWG